MSPAHALVRKIYRVIDVGDLVRSRFCNSLAVFSDESQRFGIQFPRGLVYVGPAATGLFKPVDETRLQVAFDPDLIQDAQIVSFLEEYGIVVAP